MAHEHPQVRVSPIFPVTDLRRALEHYASLGCQVSTNDEGYGFAALAGVLDYRDYTTTTHGLTALQASPLKPAAGDAGRTRTGDLAEVVRDVVARSVPV